MYLDEVVPPGPKAAREAEKVRTRLLNQVDERRHPRTRATITLMLERYFEDFRGKVLTLKNYRAKERRHIRPLIGHVSVGDMDAHAWDSFHRELRRCRVHCDGKKRIDHRTIRPHTCDHRCPPHQCRGLAEGSLRQIMTILSGAFREAIRWKWITVSPIGQARSLGTPVPNPRPPNANDAARILRAAWEDDPDWGMFVWICMRTGERRGEVCALKLDLLDLDAHSLGVDSSIAQDGARTWEKSTKTHQKRRTALDDIDVALLRAYLVHRARKAAALGVTIAAHGRLFSPDPDHATWFKPSTVGQRFKRLCDRLGMNASLKRLREYAATELIAAGVDIRTVAGRLGHGGGGTTTMKTYAAFVAEADQRAAALTSPRVPVSESWLQELVDGQERSALPEEPSEPYEKIAVDLAGAIRAGILTSGSRLPSMKELAARYFVAPSTVHRAVDVLKRDGLVAARRGVPVTVQ
ncbi:hypothetical protein Afil01_15120 [Actinorhabdospora filicis]|uniref:Uncharacterized protein n=1 Tax=Actinorhabdospora filicis TaxID=1785913 RepID=A0A9W6SGG9_9ACTN|nr:tyrosine-type recombinase/integrase [Actinorhabdospora filicis]GLZ76705.1 hypothetical protein Afil01_15120 [Actinorhabdospora filicis]